jgi:Carboxypeptidase regulatory-like domain
VKDFAAQRAAALIALVALAACSDGSRNSNARISVTPKADDSAAGTVDVGGGSTYSVAPVTRGGTVSGTIRLDGAPPIDTIAVTRDQKLCGTHPAGRIVGTPDGLADVLVWIADVKTGKSMPIDKRVELDSEQCALDPRVQGAVVGSTVNVFNDDRLLHRLVFTRAGTHDTLSVMPFFSDGQIVASEKLAKRPGIVAVTCSLHPWTHGYIAVFDHPYFEVTEKNGKFSLDSLPPGDYKLMVWHEGMGTPIERKVTVTPGGNEKVDIPIKLRD